MTANLILTNAQVPGLDPQQPLADTVAVSGANIVAVGGIKDLRTLRGPDTRLIDCMGLTLLPGFVDAHCHLLALAGSLTGIGCGEASIKSISDLMGVIGRHAGRTSPGEWIRGYGYDDLSLREMRHPTRWDLDPVTPQHPVRLNHRSGHAVVLNSQGLAIAGIGRDTPDPVDGVIQRDPGSGEPTGVLFEMAGFLRQQLALSPVQRDQGISRLNQKLLECGITSVQDAGPNNDLARWSVLREMVDSGSLISRVTMMAGATHLQEFTDAGMTWGSGDPRLRLGHAKIMQTMTTGGLHPASLELNDLVSRCHQRGFPVAIHAVESAAVTAAASVLGENRISTNTGGDAGHFDRIEHCSECPDRVLSQIRACGAMVVTQPGFVYWNGDAYLERVQPELHPYLYPINAMLGAEISIAFSSDAPVIDPDPWPGIYSAVTGYTRLRARWPNYGSDCRGGPTSLAAALRMYTIGGATAEGTQRSKGSIRPGKLADLILVDTNPFEVSNSALKDIRTVITVVGGSVAWERSR